MSVAIGASTYCACLPSGTAASRGDARRWPQLRARDRGRRGGGRGRFQPRFRRRQDPAVGDIEDFGSTDARIAPVEALRVHPVRRRPAIIEQARGRQDEGAGAERTILAPRSCAATRESFNEPTVRRAGRTSLDDIVSACSSFSSRAACRRESRLHADSSSPAPTTAISYHGSTMSLRSRPKTLHGIAKSKVSAP